MNLSYSKEETFDIHSEQPHDHFVYLFEHISQNAKLYKVFLSEMNMPHFPSRMQEVLLDFISKGMYNMQPDDQRLTIPSSGGWKRTCLIRPNTWLRSSCASPSWDHMRIIRLLNSLPAGRSVPFAFYPALHEKNP
ncbi:TetR-like C-terminal domain-containing protein [Brevibacillus nitrificans]|uniref:TetR-like C-terminal domain-containing protein n=1 Tax=Brevibacillus nitrificans TaxID=651560 RepID=UPI00285E7CB3|nr:TetR-like C-terminal domain-containing protein [Brevibacillus nitrificans]MDR7315717.1 hypothetical protein [Brevibacillus nitrificans]